MAFCIFCFSTKCLTSLGENDDPSEGFSLEDFNPKFLLRVSFEFFTVENLEAVG